MARAASAFVMQEPTWADMAPSSLPSAYVQPTRRLQTAYIPPAYRLLIAHITHAADRTEQLRARSCTEYDDW